MQTLKTTADDKKNLNIWSENSVLLGNKNYFFMKSNHFSLNIVFSLLCLYKNIPLLLKIRGGGSFRNKIQRSESKLFSTLREFVNNFLENANFEKNSR